MPSSISSSDAAGSDAAAAAVVAERPVARPGLRLTASDRPGVAQPVPERDIPPQPWGRILAIAAALFLFAMAGWEWYWRDFGARPAYRNSNGQWAIERRRINQGEGDALVLAGASRVLFDVQLPEWERATGVRPIQLAMEGTSPLPMVEDLAADPDFTGELLIGVAPDIFFSGFAYRGDVVDYTKKQGPSQRSGTWLSMHLLEPYFAFYEDDFALATVVRRQDWPLRPGMPQRTRVRKLAESAVDRNTWMWDKVATDPEYRALARAIWAEDFGGPFPNMDTPEKAKKVIDAEIARAKKAIDPLRARGVKVLFVRLPSSGEYYAFEQKYFPRAQTWDRLLAETGTPGIHFEDHPQLQGYELPEWSHASAPEARRMTLALAPLVRSTFEARATVRTDAAVAPAGTERGAR
jgi:hypothetical protein